MAKDKPDRNNHDLQDDHDEGGLDDLLLTEEQEGGAIPQSLLDLEEEEDDDGFDNPLKNTDPGVINQTGQEWEAKLWQEGVDAHSPAQGPRQVGMHIEEFPPRGNPEGELESREELSEQEAEKDEEKA